MAKKMMTKKTKLKTKKTAPSPAAREAADAMLAVPTMLGLMAQSIQQMTAQLDQMDVALRELTAKVLAQKGEPTPNLLVEPAPAPLDSSLLQEFKHEPKGNIP